MENDEDDIAAIHREALKHLFASTPSAGTNDDDAELELLQQRLTTLRKRRLELHAALMQIEFEQQFRPLSEAGSNKSFSSATINWTSPHSQSLAERMHSLRKRRRIVGSHRIAGVSIIPVPSDRNVLGIRLDISIIGGVYVAKHLLFFDIVTSVKISDNSDDDDDDDSSEEDEPKRYFLRLHQHTLPPSVALPKLIQQHFGGHNMLELPGGGSLITKEVDVLAIIRGLVGEIHDGCHSYAVRKAGVDFLKKYVVSQQSSCSPTPTDDQEELDFCVSKLNFPDTYGHIDFEVAWTTPANFQHNDLSQKLVIKLEYGEEGNAQPTKVHVTTALLNGTDDATLKNKSINLLYSKPLWSFFKGLQGEP